MERGADGERHELIDNPTVGRVPCRVTLSLPNERGSGSASDNEVRSPPDESRTPG